MIHIPKQTLFISIGVVALLVAAGAVLTAHHYLPNTDTKTTATTKLTTTGTQRLTASNTTATSASNPTKSSTAQPDNTNTPPTTAACKLLSPGVAKQIIGNDAKTGTPSDTSKLQTPATVVSACSYSSGTATVQLVVRTPKNSLGVSENDIAFGSEKPAGVTTVTGYGQSAYWDPTAKQLDILSSNSWYIITRDTGTQADAEATAKLLAPGF